MFYYSEEYKTYWIANDFLSEEWEVVKDHSSYDYTDKHSVFLNGVKVAAFSGYRKGISGFSDFRCFSSDDMKPKVLGVLREAKEKQNRKPILNYLNILGCKWKN